MGSLLLSTLKLLLSLNDSILIKAVGIMNAGVPAKERLHIFHCHRVIPGNPVGNKLLIPWYYNALFYILMP